VEPDLVHLVREALTHYWGGPRLTRSPLLGLRIVQEAIDDNNGNAVNALRFVLTRAVERVRPTGERRFTGEWMLYNILEMKFLEGRKVRDVALRLAMSEADLYRKQRVAIEAVAVAITQMEKESASRNGRRA
ncbi:MAG: putative rane protein, partial [Anaerolineales bacterium]|nr:putative rane protein [Anaerolineales bacterium]